MELYILIGIIYLAIGLYMMSRIHRGNSSYYDPMELWEYPTIVIVWPAIIAWGLYCKLLKR